MKIKTRICSAAVLAGLLGAMTTAQAALISDTLGNNAPGFANGSTPTVIQIGAAQLGQPAPFDMGIGNEVIGPDFSAMWTHNYGAIGDPILSANITFGIADHDSAASGNQLLSFTFGGASLTATLNPLFEAVGQGAEGQYDVYTLALPGSTFAGLATGSATGALSLQPPGLVIPLFPLPGPNPPIDSAFNGAFLIFSTLDIRTQDPTVPEPSVLALSLLGLGTVGWRYRRRKA